MPSRTRTNTMPTVIHTKSTSSNKERVVGFNKDPVSAVSRPVNNTESWAMYDFEMHARNCAYCDDPYNVHRHHKQLCDQGHRLAQEVARYIYQDIEGETYSYERDEDDKIVHIEIPVGYDQVRGLLKAIERSIRKSRSPFVSFDRHYPVAARTPKRSHSVKIEQPKPKVSRPRSGEIVDWPTERSSPVKSKPTVLTEVNNSLNIKRGSLYEQDLEMQRRNAKRYSVEVREPSARDIREHRLSGYYR